MKHPFTLAPLLLPLFLLLALTGCNTTSKEGATPGARIRDPNAPNAQILFNQVVFLDPTLTDFKGDGRIATENQGARRTPTNNLEVFAVFRNRTNFDQQLQVRARFFDSDQVPLGDATGWERLFLSPLSVGNYKTQSLSPSAAYYLIEVREAR